MTANLNPEQEARVEIDGQLVASSELDLSVESLWLMKVGP